MLAPASTAPTSQQRALRPLVEDHVVDLWPAFGEAVGVNSRSAALRALNKLEAAGQITPIRGAGRKLRVPSAAVLRLLGLSHAEAAAIVYGPGGAPEGGAGDQIGSEVADTESTTPTHEIGEALDSTSDGAQ